MRKKRFFSGKNTEMMLHRAAVLLTAAGLTVSLYYNTKTLKADRIASEVSTYLHLNDRYHNLLFTLIQNDSEVFKKTDFDSLQKNKYVLYELFALLATVHSLEGYLREINEDVWLSWDRRTQFLFSKPAVLYAWEFHLVYAEQVYGLKFIEKINALIASSSDEVQQPSNADARQPRQSKHEPALSPIFDAY